MRHPIAMSLGLAMVAGVACTSTVPVPSPTPTCSQTPIAEHVIKSGRAAGSSQWGRLGGDVLFQAGNPPHLPPYVYRAAPKIEKIALVLAERISPDPPQTLEVRGRELTSGTSEVFVISHLISSLGSGVHWGGGFRFPRPGCWELSIDAPRNSGAIVLEVLPAEP